MLYCTDCLEVVAGSIYPSSELIDFEKFTNSIIIIITMSAGGGGRELEVPIHSK